ncbi:transposase [Streptomyces sp. NPDC059649]
MAVPLIWAGMDIGKTHHHAVVINGEDERLLSRRIQNDGPVTRSPSICVL